MTSQPSNPVQIQVARLEGALEQVDKRLGSIETRLGNLENKLDTRTDSLETKLDNGFAELRRDLQGVNNRVTALVVIGILVPILLYVLNTLRATPG